MLSLRIHDVIATRLHASAASAGGVAADAGRRLGLLPHQPEDWSVERWTDAYAAGHLAYYGGLDELARYALLAGYVRFFASPMPGGQAPRLLDVGCGTGILLEHLRGVELAEYVGVDLSATAIASAEGRGEPGSRFVVGDVREMDLGTSDVIVLNEMLYYIDDPRAFLAQLADRLSAGGILLVSMWRHPGDRLLWRTVGDAFDPLDRVHARNRANRVNRRGWYVGAFRHRTPA